MNMKKQTYYLAKNSITLFIIVIMNSLTFGQNEKFNPPGKLTKLDNGSNLHAYTKGSGTLTYVFTAGFGSPSAYIDYFEMANHFSNNNRVFIFDRLGVGWSDDVDTSIDFDNTANQLHEVLQKCNEKPPYILVAHSFGSLETLHFASLYPNEVAGIVLIDGTSPVTYKNFEVEKAVKFFKKIQNNKGLFNFALHLGLIGEVNKRHQFLPVHLRKTDKYLLKKNFANNAMIETTKKIKTFADTVNNSIAIKDIPLLVLSCKTTFSEAGFKYTNWENDQKYLVSLSNVSSKIFLEGKHATVHLSEQKTIIEAIEKFTKNTIK